jgi:hypothetical protein
MGWDGMRETLSQGRSMGWVVVVVCGGGGGDEGVEISRPLAFPGWAIMAGLF